MAIPAGTPIARLLRLITVTALALLLSVCFRAPGVPEVAGTARFVEALPVDAQLTVRLMPDSDAAGANLFEHSQPVAAGVREVSFVLPYDPVAAKGVTYVLRGRVDGDGLLWLGEGKRGLELDDRGLRLRIDIAAP